MKLSLLLLAIAGTSAIAASLSIPQQLPAAKAYEPSSQSRYEQFDTMHSGGLDKNGGHTDSKTGVYHFHKKK